MIFGFDFTEVWGEAKLWDGMIGFDDSIVFLKKNEAVVQIDIRDFLFQSILQIGSHSLFPRECRN